MGKRSPYFTDGISEILQQNPILVERGCDTTRLVVPNSNYYCSNVGADCVNYAGSGALQDFVCCCNDKDECNGATTVKSVFLVMLTSFGVVFIALKLLYFSAVC